MFVSISQAAQILGVCPKTLRRWHHKNSFCPDHYTSGGHRRYSLTTLNAYLNRPLRIRKMSKLDKPLLIHAFSQAAIYARVSALEQKSDLDRQTRKN